MRVSYRRRPNLRMPESIEVTIDQATGPSAPWSRACIRERTWREAVGGRIADRARPVELNRGILRVRVATSVWASELSLLSEQILARLRERGVPVTNLRFHVGPVERFGGPADPRETRAVPSRVALPKELEEALRVLSDDDLRERITDAARANLAWQDSLSPQLAARGSARSTAAQPVARGLRAAGTEIDRRDQTSASGPEGSRCIPGASPRRTT
jgi:predicted nucleic acid-binding Zn ribbon protein